MKIGWIDYLNTLPFDITLTGVKPNLEIELVKGVPSQINEKLKKKEIDIGFISSAEYLQNFKDYLIFPELSISALNKVESVCIFSNEPLEKVKTVYLTKASKTSRLLTKIIFKYFLKKDIKYENLEDYTDIENKTVLLIGDNAIKYKNMFKYVYDLSAIWYRETNYPFVFALWCVRKDFFEEEKENVFTFYDSLKKSKEKFFSNIDFFLEEANINIDKAYAYKYLKNLDYCLTQEHINSLELFSSYLKKEGLIKEIPTFEFIK